MIYSYDKIMEIALKLDKSIVKLDESSLNILNALKTQLNIPITVILKKTVINKQNDISQIFKLLNKMTDKNYDKLKVELFDIIENINNLDEINKITELIFKIASSNIFYSNLFSKLYCELIQIKREFYNVFQDRFDIHTKGLLDKLQYADPNTHYDEYCIYVKQVETLKASLTFFINLMKKNVCSLDNIVDLALTLLNSLIENKSSAEQNEEYINNIFIIIKECIDFLIFHDKMNIIYDKIIIIQKLNISKKINFKCLDILDIIKEYN